MLGSKRFPDPRRGLFRKLAAHGDLLGVERQCQHDAGDRQPGAGGHVSARRAIGGDRLPETLGDRQTKNRGTALDALDRQRGAQPLDRLGVARLHLENPPLEVRRKRRCMAGDHLPRRRHDGGIRLASRLAERLEPRREHLEFRDRLSATPFDPSLPFLPKALATFAIGLDNLHEKVCVGVVETADRADSAGKPRERLLALKSERPAFEGRDLERAIESTEHPLRAHPRRRHLVGSRPELDDRSDRWTRGFATKQCLEASPIEAAIEPRGALDAECLKRLDDLARRGGAPIVAASAARGGARHRDGSTHLKQSPQQRSPSLEKRPRLFDETSLLLRRERAAKFAGQCH